MSLVRQLLSVVTGISSGAFFLAAFFLSIRMYLLSPAVFARESNKFSEFTDSEKSTLLPQSIYFPSGLEVPLQKSNLKGEVWEVSNYAASFFIPSGLSDEDQGYIIYGHNWPKLFGELKNVKQGDKIRLKTSTIELDYTVVFITNVKPSEVEVLSFVKPRSMVIYTCSGLLDSQRLVAFATLD